MIDYSIELINNPAKLVKLVERLSAVSVFALDIETVDWWNRHQERIALIQIAFRTVRGVKVSVIDALGKLDLETLRLPLESNSTTKIIHNAAFDATRMFNHYKFKVAPIHDTMLAARRNGEKKCSLQTQAATHLNLHLDKRAQRSDWSRRPLDLKQISYAAQDAYAALRLYELQVERGLDGLYRLKEPSSSIQGHLPLNNSPESVNQQQIQMFLRGKPTHCRLLMPRLSTYPLHRPLCLESLASCQPATDLNSYQYRLARTESDSPVDY
jgi:hypothetical protein